MRKYSEKERINNCKLQENYKYTAVYMQQIDIQHVASAKNLLWEQGVASSNLIIPTNSESIGFQSDND